VAIGTTGLAIGITGAAMGTPTGRPRGVPIGGEIGRPTGIAAALSAFVFPRLMSWAGMIGSSSSADVEVWAAETRWINWFAGNQLPERPMRNKVSESGVVARISRARAAVKGPVVRSSLRR